VQLRYRSVYLDHDGSRSTAVLEARDEQELHEQLFLDGRVLLQAKPAKGDAGSGRAARLSSRKLLVLVQSLESALDAGVPILAALAAMQDQEKDPRFERIYRRLFEQVEAGLPLSAAMAEFPRSFSPVLCAMVEAGEESGSLPGVLASLGEYLVWKQELTSTARQAMIYPIVVLSAGYGLVLFLMSFVVPRLGDIIAKLGEDALPWAGRMLIESSSFVAANIHWVVLGSIAAVLVAILGLRTDRGRSGATAVIVRIPVARSVVRTLSLAQTCRNLHVLLGAGLTVTHALQLTSRAVNERQLRSGLERAREGILSGSKINEAFQRERLLPPVALTMLRVGEDAGRLPSSFGRLSTLYDREAKDAVKRALAMLEPAVTVVLGIIVGGVAALIITTIYTAMGAMGK